MTFVFTLYVRQTCRPQHVAFISGVACYCIGTVGHWPVGLVALVAVFVVMIMSKPQRRGRDRSQDQE
jgi:hypothetical protein